jgi:uncharacterized membrane protein YqjE
MKKERFEDHDTAAATPTSVGRSVSQILQEMVNHLTEIIRSEVQLARTEIGKDLSQVAKAGGYLIVGAVLSLYALGFVLLAAVYALETRMAPWLSAILVGVAAGLIAMIFFSVGRKRIKQTSLRPDQTIQSLKENIRWKTEQTRL